VSTGRLSLVEPLPLDPLAYAQCVVLDATIFPHASVPLVSSPEAVWIARDAPGGPILAFLSTIRKAALLYVVGLGVAPSERRRGLARALLRAAADAARRRRVGVVALHVSTANPGAIALYHSEGFVRVRRIRRFYSPRVFANGGDAYEMRLDLAPTDELATG
jgi:ribosomal protein S18 acetylase RimI-like enzyme